MCPAGTGQVSPHRLIHSNPISLYLVSTFVFFIIIITLSCQHICVLYHHYYFILSVHLYSFLPLSHYLVSKFVFILIIITLSCHLSAHLSSLSLSSLYFVSIISVVKMKHSSELFVQSRFNKRGLQKKHFPPNLLFWTLICLFIFWY